MFEYIITQCSDLNLFWDAEILRTREIMVLFKLWIHQFVRLFWSWISGSPYLILLLNSKNRGPCIDIVYNRVKNSFPYFDLISKNRFARKWKCLVCFQKRAYSSISEYISLCIFISHHMYIHYTYICTYTSFIQHQHI